MPTVTARLIILACGLAVTLAVGTACAPAARVPHPPALKMIWGPNTLPNGASAFPVYKQLGVQVLQVDLLWTDAAPTQPANPRDPNDPAYQWPATVTTAVQQAARYGIRICLLVESTPAWANGNQTRDWAPTDPAAYANFVYAASQHYPTVHYWMIWGEPTRPGNFSPMPRNSPVGPRAYALLLDDAYGALKQESPANTVIGGDTWTFGLVTPPDFIRWMRLPNGLPPRLDYYGDNPYSRRFPDLALPPYNAGVRDIDDVDTLHSELAAAYRTRGFTPKLWLSEFSVASDHTNRAFDFFVSEPAQAKWLSAAYKLVNSVDYVAGLGWYDLYDEAPTVPGHLTLGLMSWQGKPKPAFYAYKAAP